MWLLGVTASVVRTGSPAVFGVGPGVASHSDAISAQPNFARVEILDVAAAAGAWRELTGAGVSSPYQSSAWFAAWTGGEARGKTPFIALVRDDRGRAVLLLPLIVTRSFGIGVARFAGGKHANFNAPPRARDYTPSEADLASVFAAVARLRPDVDLLALDAMPEAWNGSANPLVGRAARPHSSRGWCVDLTPAERPLRGVRRRKREWQDRQLALGGRVVTRVAQSPDDVVRALGAFADHKIDWFAARRLPNPFRDDHIMAALARLAGDPASGCELRTLEVGGAVVAVTGTLFGARRASLMFVSYDARAAAASASPGTRLIRDAMSEARRRGLAAFDFGLGEAAYKARLGAKPEAVFSLLQPLTRRGAVAARGLALLRVAKIAAKRHARLVSMLQRLRTAMAGRG